LTTVTDAIASSGLYTKLGYVSSGSSPEETVDRVVTLVTMVETIDGVSLTLAERLILAMFLAFVSLRTDAIIGNDITAVVRFSTRTGTRR
jgi:MoxR-like ATPase